MAKNIFRDNRGYGLVEMLVYTALLGIIFLVIVGVVSLVGRTNSRIVSVITLNSGASAAMERMIYEIKNATKVYAPTSNFGTIVDPQLSLATTIGAEAGEGTTYVDFYLDNATIFMKQEGSEPIALTSPDISVEELSFNYYKNDKRESVKIDFTAHPVSGLSSSVTTHLVTAVAFR